MHDAAEPNARARDGPAAVAVRTPGSINLPGHPALGAADFEGKKKITKGVPQL